MEIRVYPEYYEGPLLSKDIEICGRRVDDQSRMMLLKDGNIKMYYDKIAAPTTEFKPRVYIYGSVAVGLICCRDINNSVVYRSTMEELSVSGCEHKVIVISAHMTDKSWFSGDTVPPYLKNYYVILSNGCDGGPNSFISNTSGLKISELEIQLDNVKIIICGVP